MFAMARSCKIIFVILLLGLFLCIMFLLDRPMYTNYKTFGLNSLTPMVPVSIEFDTELSVLKRVLQRAIFSAKEMQDFIRNEINQMRTRDNAKNKESVDRFQDLSDEYNNVIQSDLNKIDELLKLKTLRISLWKNLTSIVQSRIDKLQNPSSCIDEEPYYCCFSNPWGFTSMIHDLLSCSMKAYYAKKRFALVTEQWHYHQGVSWDTFFEPVSSACPKIPENVLKNKAKCFQDSYGNPSRDVLTSLPFDLASDLMFLGRNPLPFWYSQFVGRVMKPNQKLRELIENTKKEIGFEHPIVGFHVRRTDKIGTEALKHNISEYITYAERHFRKLELAKGGKTIPRRVFVATDEPGVIKECRESYPNYTFIFNLAGSKLAQNLSTRYSDDSIWGVILDLYLLASTDHLVCTFSSGMGRLSFELMQFLNPDALSKVDSLDVSYHYVFARSPANKVIYQHSHKRKGELDMDYGDFIQKKDEHVFRVDAMAGKRPDGTSTGVNNRTHLSGFFPTFKSEPSFKIETYEVVNYNQLLKIETNNTVGPVT